MQEKSASTPKQNETDDHVKLKPVMGIRPGVWLTVLYSFILLVILFFLLVFPGLVRGGAVLTVKTEPMGAAVRINGAYRGTSADRIFLPRGSYTVEAVLPGFEKAGTVCEIPRRVFGSLFFPLRRQIEFTLTAPDPAGALALSAAEFAAWSFGPEPTAAWQIPLSLSEGAYRAGPADDPAMREIIKAASRFTTTRAALRDLVRAKILLDNRGLSPSPAGLIGSISDILLFLSENPGSAEWLAALLPQESAGPLNASNWLKNEHPSFTVHTLAAAETAAAFPAQLELSGLSFRVIPAANITNAIPDAFRFFHDASIGNFMICEIPVPRPLFETFISENPEWKEGQTDYYPEQISVYPPQTFGTQVITGVTWFAAQAFCLWLTERLPASLAGMEVRLPTEAEWEFAANSGIGNMGESGWEWCADPFAPLKFIAPPGAIQAVGSPERALRGKISSSGEGQRASLPPELSSPFVSFRPVIADRPVISAKDWYGIGCW
jgi:hypothetical protein